MKGNSDDIGLLIPEEVSRSGGPSGPRIMPSAFTGNSSNRTEKSSSVTASDGGLKGKNCGVGFSCTVVFSV